MHDDDAGSGPLSRRHFLGGLGLSAAALTAGGLLSGCGDDGPDSAAAYDGERVRSAPAPGSRGDWGGVRSLFELDPRVRHMSAFVLAPHPRPVRAAIARHRDGLDRDPHGYYEANGELELKAAEAAAAHLGTSPDLLALTDSTSMGLGLLIGGLRLEPGDELLLTAHDHYMAHESARLASERAGASVKTIELYPPGAPEQATAAGMAAALRAGIGARTRLVLLTWVQTATGIRLPLRELADVVAAANEGRAEEERALVLVDGAHALGAGPIALEETGADAFVASGHKWLMGPRGTGVAWATEQAWARLTPTIPSWSGLGPWIDGGVAHPAPGRAFTPGGYHSFEHRWALREAFELQREIGEERIAARIDALASRLRDGLAAIPRVTVHAPAEPALRSGIVCFSVDGSSPGEVVERLDRDHRVAASVTPYAVQFARMGTTWVNTEQEVDAAVRAVARVAA